MGDPPLNGVLLTDTYCQFWYIFTWTACQAVSWKSLSCLPLSSHQQWSFSVQMECLWPSASLHLGDEIGQGIWPHRGSALTLPLVLLQCPEGAEYYEWVGAISWKATLGSGLLSLRLLTVSLLPPQGSASGKRAHMPACHPICTPQLGVTDWAASVLLWNLKVFCIILLHLPCLFICHLTPHLSSRLPLPVSLPLVRLLRQQGIHTYLVSFLNCSPQYCVVQKGEGTVHSVSARQQSWTMKAA